MKGVSFDPAPDDKPDFGRTMLDEWNQMSVDSYLIPYLLSKSIVRDRQRQEEFRNSLDSYR